MTASPQPYIGHLGSNATSRAHSPGNRPTQAPPLPPNAARLTPRSGSLQSQQPTQRTLFSGWTALQHHSRLHAHPYMPERELFNGRAVAAAKASAYMTRATPVVCTSACATPVACLLSCCCWACPMHSCWCWLSMLLGGAAVNSSVATKLLLLAQRGGAGCVGSLCLQTRLLQFSTCCFIWALQMLLHTPTDGTSLPVLLAECMVRLSTTPLCH